MHEDNELRTEVIVLDANEALAQTVVCRVALDSCSLEPLFSQSPQLAFKDELAGRSVDEGLLWQLTSDP